MTLSTRTHPLGLLLPCEHSLERRESATCPTHLPILELNQPTATLLNQIPPPSQNTHSSTGCIVHPRIPIIIRRIYLLPRIIHDARAKLVPTRREPITNQSSVIRCTGRDTRLEARHVL